MGHTKRTRTFSPDEEPDPKLTVGITCAMLNNIETLGLELGEAAGCFLLIEPLMRLIAELHVPFREKISTLIKREKYPPIHKNYWDCDPRYLVKSIDAIFGKDIGPEKWALISRFSSVRGKFLHGNYIELIDVIGIEPEGRELSGRAGQARRNGLEPHEIKEAFLSMQRTMYSEYYVDTL